MLQPVQRRSLADSVYEQLLRRIVEGALPAGAALPSERALTAQLGVSRTAVREALVRLEQAGLITTRHGGESRALDYRDRAGLDLLPQLVLDAEGHFHTEVARSGLEMRAAVAPDIARRCAIRASPQTDADLRRVLDAMDSAGDDLQALQELSMRFWETLTVGSGNVAYRLALNSLRQMVVHMREPIAQAMAPELRDREGYRAIAAAVERRAPDDAAAAARAHIEHGLEPMCALVERREPSQREGPR